MVVAEHIAVVGKEEDQRVVVQASSLQSGYDAPDLLIDERHRAVVGPAGFFCLAEAEVAVPHTRVGRLLMSGVPVGPVSDIGGGHIVHAVHIQESLRRVVGAVRPGEGDFQ